MKKFKKVLTSVVLMSTIAIASCNGDKNSTPASTTLKKVSFEVTGNYTGTLFVSYTTASGSTANDAITLPWSKTITYANSISAGIIAISGQGGTVGQTATVVVKQGNILKSSTTATASGTFGSFSVSAPALTL